MFLFKLNLECDDIIIIIIIVVTLGLVLGRALAAVAARDI